MRDWQKIKHIAVLHWLTRRAEPHDQGAVTLSLQFPDHILAQSKLSLRRSPYLFRLWMAHAFAPSINVESFKTWLCMQGLLNSFRWGLHRLSDPPPTPLHGSNAHWEGVPRRLAWVSLCFSNGLVWIAYVVVLHPGPDAIIDVHSLLENFRISKLLRIMLR